MFLHIERDGITAYAPGRRRHAEVRRQANERFLLTRTTPVLGIVVTTDRYLGYGIRGSGWRKVNRLPLEKLVDLRVQDSSAIILTSHRVLTFDGRGWTTRTRRRIDYLH